MASLITGTPRSRYASHPQEVMKNPTWGNDADHGVGVQVGHGRGEDSVNGSENPALGFEGQNGREVDAVNGQGANARE